MGVYRVALWIFGEYCQSKEMIIKIIDQICSSIGQLPLITIAQEKNDDDDKKNDDDDDNNNTNSNNQGQQPQYLTRTVVLPDGTYAQSTMAMTNKIEQDLDLDNQSSIKTHHLRKLLKNGEYFLASVLSLTLLKLISKYKTYDQVKNNDINKLTAKSLLIITSIIRYGTSPSTKHKIDNDTKDRMMYVLNKLFNDKNNDNKIEKDVLLNKCRNNFGKMLLE